MSPRPWPAATRHCRVRSFELTPRLFPNRRAEPQARRCVIVRRRPRCPSTDLVVCPVAFLGRCLMPTDAFAPLRLLLLLHRPSSRLLTRDQHSDGGEGAPRRERAVVPTARRRLRRARTGRVLDTRGRCARHAAVWRVTSSRLCACCVAHRRVCSFEPSTTTTVSARRAASESLFDRAPSGFVVRAPISPSAHAALSTAAPRIDHRRLCSIKPNTTAATRACLAASMPFRDRASSRLCACCIAHRRVCSLEPNTTRAASAHRAARQ